MIPRGAWVPMQRGAFVVAMAMLLASCAGNAPKPVPKASTPATRAPEKRPARKPWKPLGPYTPGGLYAPGVADGTPDVLPDVANLPEPVPHAEPLSRYGNRSPYTVLGKTYTVLPSAKGYHERGIASWYGTKFDGRATSNFEQYDVSQFSAAHRTLPLPSYARVTNLDNGRSVVVRINDRGPFHDGRLIDLSYAAAVKLGVNVHGTARVEVQGIDPGEPPASKPKDTTADIAAGASSVANTARRDSLKPAPGATAPPPKAAVATPPVLLSAVDDDATTMAGAAIGPAVVVDALPPAVAPAASVTGVPQSTSAPTNTAPVATIPAPPQPVMGRPAIDATTHGFLQVASYSNRAYAERMLQRVQQAGIGQAELVSVQVAGQTLWRVHVGPLNATDAEAIAEHLDQLGFGHPPFFKD